MRGDVAVSGGEQRVVGTGRFLRKHIQSGGKDGSVVQCIGKVLFVDQRTASGVDEDGVGLHLFQAGGIDQFTGGVGEGAVQADDVAVGKSSSSSVFLISGGSWKGDLDVYACTSMPKPMAMRAVL